MRLRRTVNDERYWFWDGIGRLRYDSPFGSYQCLWIWGVQHARRKQAPLADNATQIDMNKLQESLSIYVISSLPRYRTTSA